jgi:O-antigen/teichoic acid export membrane protein
VPDDATEVPRAGAKHAQRLVVRNTLVSFAGQVVGTPLAIAVSAITARYLGAGDFGELYVAWMIVAFGAIFVDWGHGGVLPAEIARDRTRAGALLGSSLAWRVVATAVVYACMALGCMALGYDADFQVVLGLVVVQCFLQTMTNGCQDAIRGFERTDIGALGQVGTQLLMLFIVGPTLFFGGRVHGVLIAQAVVSAIVMISVVRALSHVGIPRLTLSRDTLRSLLKAGTPFLFFSFAMAAQPNVDAVMLKQLAPAEVVGWHAVARRLVGPLILPGSLVIGALYPTLCRLYGQDRSGYVETARNAIQATAILSMPVALSCALYPEVGIAIFSNESFGGARQNLIVLSLFLLLVYFSMPLGVALLAAGRQRVWATVQLACVGVSAALDPLLIPWFQKHWQNGGLGVCVAGVVSECLMVAAGLVLMGRAVLNGALGVTLVRTVVAGAAMASTAFALRHINPFVAAPLALASYAGALLLVGGLNRSQLTLLRSAVARKAPT